MSKAKDTHKVSSAMPQQMNSDMVHAINERGRLDVFQYYPSQSQMKLMIEKAVITYEKQ